MAARCTMGEQRNFNLFKCVALNDVMMGINFQFVPSCACAVTNAVTMAEQRTYACAPSELQYVAR